MAAYSGLLCVRVVYRAGRDDSMLLTSIVRCSARYIHTYLFIYLKFRTTRTRWLTSHRQQMWNFEISKPTDISAWFRKKLWLTVRNPALCPHSLSVGFLRFSQQPLIISPNSIHQYFVVTEMECLPCQAGNEIFNIFWYTSFFNRLVTNFFLRESQIRSLRHDPIRPRAKLLPPPPPRKELRPYRPKYQTR
jgi:hypothetical protein